MYLVKYLCTLVFIFKIDQMSWICINVIFIMSYVKCDTDCLHRLIGMFNKSEINVLYHSIISINLYTDDGEAKHVYVKLKLMWFKNTKWITYMLFFTTLLFINDLFIMGNSKQFSNHTRITYNNSAKLLLERRFVCVQN